LRLSFIVGYRETSLRRIDGFLPLSGGGGFGLCHGTRKCNRGDPLRTVKRKRWAHNFDKLARRLQRIPVLGSDIRGSHESGNLVGACTCEKRTCSDRTGQQEAEYGVKYGHRARSRENSSSPYRTMSVVSLPNVEGIITSITQ
jgi:hypothetical protein